MRYFLALTATSLALVLSGCDISQRIAHIRTFSLHPVVEAAGDGRSKQELLNIQKPTQITSIRGGTAQCFDYMLERDGKKGAYFVSFTSDGWANNWGYGTCAKALVEDGLLSNERMKKNPDR